MSVSEIEAALQSGLPPDLRPHAPPLARLLADVGSGALGPEAAQRQLAADFPGLLQALAGQSVATPASVISFANNDQQNATITISGLAFGGYACLSHYALRLVLWRHGALPLDYVRFLDYCVDRILLRRVGGGYIFVNRMLLEHFASLGESGAPQAAPVAPQAVAP